jgi:hypothetical protein
MRWRCRLHRRLVGACVGATLMITAGYGAGYLATPMSVVEEIGVAGSLCRGCVVSHAAAASQGNNAWLGANATIPTGPYTWQAGPRAGTAVNGSEATFWARDQPDSPTRSQDWQTCLLFWALSGPSSDIYRWDNQNCETPLFAIYRFDPVAGSGASSSSGGLVVPIAVGAAVGGLVLFVLLLLLARRFRGAAAPPAAPPRAGSLTAAFQNPVFVPVKGINGGSASHYESLA